ncbi:NAD(P)/FAD-dependent oxidoreductase [Ruegeria sp. MALMAid1280]|uniref:NAD(P)/FAD-dependent oxidoreductase n=1 Tax=Ruegeria sp. MALMAid1280 TaxID=3411634 RepID=UPI003B9E9DC6
MTQNSTTTGVAIIGAGPAGSLAAKRLVDAGHRVTVVESARHPRFSIGESLLPFSMIPLERAGLLPEIEEAGFQIKTGARFVRGAQTTDIDFRQKFEPGWGTTFQVQRARFDQILADAAERAGAEMFYDTQVVDADISAQNASLTLRNEDGRTTCLNADFVLDGSGFGRVLPRLLGLETPSDLPFRGALFTHIEDGITDPDFDRSKIVITVHPQHPEVWYWLICFSDGTSSVGVVLGAAHDLGEGGDDHTDLLWKWVNDTDLGRLLKDARAVRPTGCIRGYSKNVKSLHGPRFALLGNAAEFLDPVFSSGVTIALHSADLACEVLLRQLEGTEVDWDRDFAIPLKSGVDVFRTFVTSWYDQSLQEVIFNHPSEINNVTRMVTSILAGYAWNRDNPLVKKPASGLAAIRKMVA